MVAIHVRIFLGRLVGFLHILFEKWEGNYFTKYKEKLKILGDIKFLPDTLGQSSKCFMRLRSKMNLLMH
jgi:hypothetical protein